MTIEFDEVMAFGSAGGFSRSGIVTTTIVAKNCDTVESVRMLVVAAPNLLAVARMVLEKVDVACLFEKEHPQADLADLRRLARNAIELAEDL